MRMFWAVMLLASVAQAGAKKPTVAQRVAHAHQLIDAYHGNPAVYREASAELAAALEEAPQDPGALVAAGRLARKAEQPEEARALIDKALAIDPKFVLAMVQKGFCFLDAHDVWGARNQAQEALKVDPDSLNAQLLILYCDVDDHETEKVGKLAATLGHQRKDTRVALEALEALTDYDEGRGDVASVEKDHLELIKLAPKDPWLRGNYGNFLFYQKRYDESIKACEGALALMDYGSAHHTLSLATRGRGLELEKKEPAKAIAYLQRSVKEEPSPQACDGLERLGAKVPKSCR